MFAAFWNKGEGSLVLTHRDSCKLGLKPDTFLLSCIAFPFIFHNYRRLTDATQEVKLSTAYLSLSKSILA